MKTPLMLLATLAAGASLCAQSDSPRSSYSVTADFSYTSKYVFRGVQRTRDALQPSIDLKIGDPQGGQFYVNAWTSQPLRQHEHDEADFSAGYRFRLTGELSAEVLATYYWYPEANGGETRHSTEGGVGVTYNGGRYLPTATVYYFYDFDRQANTGVISFGYGIPIPDIGTQLDLNVYAGTSKADDAFPDSGVTVRESYNYYGADIELPYRISQNAKVTVGAHWATNEKYIAGTPRDRFWVDVGVAFGF
jgi:uncharacterized protein (TIGR02001 family)